MWSGSGFASGFRLSKPAARTGVHAGVTLDQAFDGHCLQALEARENQATVIGIRPQGAGQNRVKSKGSKAFTAAHATESFAHKPLKKLNRRQVIDSYRAAQRQGKNWKGYALPFSISSLRKQGGAPRWSRCRSSFSETGCPNGLTNVGCETNNQANCRANYVHQWLVGLCGALPLCHTGQSFMHKGHGRQPVGVPN